MGKNLARLFQDRKDAPFQVAIDANNKLGHLFRDHGEALIAALENERMLLLCCEHWISSMPENCHAMKNEALKSIRMGMSRITDLLCKLESEAQP